MMADCKDCIYSVELNYNEETKYKVECKRFPQFQIKDSYDWCGEFNDGYGGRVVRVQIEE
jgi:hypothetical protein